MRTLASCSSAGTVVASAFIVVGNAQERADEGEDGQGIHLVHRFFFFFWYSLD